MADDGYTVEWPLWGARLVERDVGLEAAMALNETLLYQPTWAQWAAMELSAVIDEYCQRQVADEAQGVHTSTLPPPCLLRLSEVDAAGQPDPSLDRQDEAARHIVGALRLYSAGDFINPAETGTYISEPDGRSSRRVEVFRCAPYRLSFASPYRIGIDDMDNLASLQLGVAELTEQPIHSNAAVALENFVLSFGFAISGAERGLHRFIALEALLGPMQDTVSGASFSVRAAHAAADLVPDAAAWLETARAMRNTLAHRTHEAVPTTTDLEMLEEVTRGVLVSYLRHMTRDDTNNPLRGFNEALSSGPISVEGI
jgi:hypothetical protein